MANGMVFLAFLIVIIGILATIWVFIDATENSSQSALLWGLVAFFGGIIGVLLYVLLGRDGGVEEEQTRSAPERGTAKFTHRCKTCGEKFHAPNREVRSCHKCGGVKIQQVA